MRLMVGYSEGGAAVFGIVGNRAINLTARDPALGTDLGALIRAGAEGLSRIAPLLSDSEDAQASGDITPALHLRSFGKIICLGLNYADHAKEGVTACRTIPPCSCAG